MPVGVKGAYCTLNSVIVAILLAASQNDLIVPLMAIVYPSLFGACQACDMELPLLVPFNVSV